MTALFVLCICTIAIPHKHLVHTDHVSKGKVSSWTKASFTQVLKLDWR